jgi:hypothetical protein
MPLINCPDCGKPVSPSAKACPTCGYPVAEKTAEQEQPVEAGDRTPQGKLLAEVKPSWWGYFWHLFFFWLIVPPIIAWFQRSSTVLRIYEGRVTVERGIFSKCYQDYNSRDIRSIDVDQSLLQRMAGIGDLTISTSATVEGSEQIKSIPDPKGVRELLLAQRGPH